MPLLWDVSAVSNCTPASKFISSHYGLGTGKSPELRTVTTCWFPILLRQLWGNSSPSPAPWFRKGKMSSGVCCNNNRSPQIEQLLWGERQGEDYQMITWSVIHPWLCFYPVSHSLSFANVFSYDIQASPEGYSYLPSANSSPAFPPS